MGARHCQTLCATLELQLKAGTQTPQLHTAFEALVAQTSALVSALDAALPARTPLVSVSATAQQQQPMRAELVKVLAQLLADSNTRAEAFMQENSGTLAHGLGDNWALLQHHVQNFDFDQALTVLQTAAAQAQLALD